MKIFESEKLADAVKFLTYIREVHDSNPGRVICSPDPKVFLFFVNPSSKMPIQY
jgi:hypothetical protein